MVTTEVAFARSTWRKSREFSDGLHELAQRMPMELVRLYVTEGARTPRVPLNCYDRIDELCELRREALLGEMPYVEAQAQIWLDEHPEDAAHMAAKHRRTTATPDMLLGTAVMNGESPAAGFSPDTYLIAPSLRVYELFMWYDESERWTQR
ncbi:hypothetical protein AALA69_10470 [Eggerthellaceae bacterium 24-137]